MKRIVSCFLVVVMLVSLMPAVFGADNEGLADAILKAKEKLLIPDTYSEFESNISTDDFGNTLYHLYWYAENELGYTDNISVEINSYGHILYYRNSAAGDDEGQMRFSAYNGEEMTEIAINWLNTVNPDWMAELPRESIFAPAYGDPRYHTDSVRFERMVNGLFYCGDSVRVSVNNLTGEIVSMNANWTYEAPAYTSEAALTKEGAAEKFLSQSPMELAYYSKGEHEAIPVYAPQNAYLQLNARTGEEFIEYNPYREMGLSGGGSNSVTMEESAADTAEEEKFSASELKNLEEIEGLLSEDVLRAAAEALEHTGLDDASFVSLSYENYKEEIDGEEKNFYNAYLSYLTPGEKELRHTVVFDAQTGELLSYSSYPTNWDESEAKIKEEAARKTAEDFLNTYAEKQFKESKEDVIKYDGNSDYGFSYIRFANGLPFHDNRISVSVDKMTGRIQRFYKHWDDEMVFAPAEGLMDAQTAGQKLMEQAGMVLSYAKAQDGESKVPAIDLLYTLNHEYPHYIDAETGALLSYNMEVYKPQDFETILPKDTEGHYAEAQILALIGSGILEGTEAFRPDAQINQKEMLAFVCGLHMGYIPYEMEFTALTKNAVRYGITGLELDPEAPVTREKAVEMIICALGYKEIAELRGIYVTNFVDNLAVMPHKLGYLALAQGLNIVQGDENGRFHPQDYLTRADAAIMIYNYLSR